MTTMTEVKQAANEAQKAIAKILDDNRHIAKGGAPYWLVVMREANAHLSLTLMDANRGEYNS